MLLLILRVNRAVRTSFYTNPEIYSKTRVSRLILRPRHLSSVLKPSILSGVRPLLTFVNGYLKP